MKSCGFFLKIRVKFHISENNPLMFWSIKVSWFKLLQIIIMITRNVWETCMPPWQPIWYTTLDRKMCIFNGINLVMTNLHTKFEVIDQTRFRATLSLWPWSLTLKTPNTRGVIYLSWSASRPSLKSSTSHVQPPYQV